MAVLGINPFLIHLRPLNKHWKLLYYNINWKLEIGHSKFLTMSAPHKSILIVEDAPISNILFRNKMTNGARRAQVKVISMYENFSQ